MTTKRIKLTIAYKTGRVHEQFVNYVHFEDDAIVYTTDKQVVEPIQEQIRTRLCNVETFDITQVECNGWEEAR